MSDGPYDYARERYDAMAEDKHGYRKINGYYYDEDDVPDLSDVID